MFFTFLINPKEEVHFCDLINHSYDGHQASYTHILSRVTIFPPHSLLASYHIILFTRYETDTSGKVNSSLVLFLEKCQH